MQIGHGLVADVPALPSLLQDRQPTPRREEGQVAGHQERRPRGTRVFPSTPAATTAKPLPATRQSTAHWEYSTSVRQPRKRGSQMFTRAWQHVFVREHLSVTWRGREELHLCNIARQQIFASKQVPSLPSPPTRPTDKPPAPIRTATASSTDTTIRPIPLARLLLISPRVVSACHRRRTPDTTLA